MAITVNRDYHMTTFRFAIALGATLALAACNNGSSEANNAAEVNAPATEDLNAAANDAANDAANAEAAALGDQQNQLENTTASTNADNATNPSDAQEQNVSGM
jgi:predicted component of type VI protein secretion system